MIYLLEDDDSIRDFVIYTLNSQGLEARGFERPSAFWEAVEERLPTLVLLDIMLPEEDGVSVLKKLRSDPRTLRLPIIMLTAKGTEYDKVLGLDAGADDYVAKPFGMMELLSPYPGAAAADRGGAGDVSVRLPDGGRAPPYRDGGGPGRGPDPEGI